MFDFETVEHNPTAKHYWLARRHGTQALQHARAAARLRQQEAAMCRNVAGSTRGTCPLSGRVARIADIAGGVRLQLRKRDHDKPTLARVRCHRARIEATGRSAMKDCPLDLPALTIRLAKQGAAIEITTSKAAFVTTLRARARACATP
ncbi:MAG: hypothetical protein KC503_43675 [Myxococcales bacterium]|nr:hypothetical protein [Myxococcales bacterium]